MTLKTHVAFLSVVPLSVDVDVKLCTCKIDFLLGCYHFYDLHSYGANKQINIHHLLMFRSLIFLSKTFFFFFFVSSALMHHDQVEQFTCLSKVIGYVVSYSYSIYIRP